MQEIPSAMKVKVEGEIEGEREGKEEARREKICGSNCSDGNI